jgi:hypothetical protein
VYQLCQLLLHPDVVDQAPLRLGLERHQEVEIALGAELAAERGTEQRELLDLPTLAERAQRAGLQAEA